MLTMNHVFRPSRKCALDALRRIVTIGRSPPERAGGAESRAPLRLSRLRGLRKTRRAGTAAQATFRRIDFDPPVIPVSQGATDRAGRTETAAGRPPGRPARDARPF